MKQETKKNSAVEHAFRKAEKAAKAVGVLMHPSSQTLLRDPNFGLVTNAKPSTMIGCEDCIRMAKEGKGSQEWVHLNYCRICGHVGCCDNSPNQHATAHFHSTSHPIIQRFEPGEDWGWDYKTGQMFEPFPREIASPFRHLDWDKGYVTQAIDPKHPILDGGW